ncbi:hypothetical protein KEM54_005112, partial [Ascosphaera aggregata]
YLVITLGDARQSTPIISKTLNPIWNTSFDFPILPGSVPLLECICWDKDRVGKDYMGEFDIALEEIFEPGETRAEARWFELLSRRKRRGASKVTTGAGLHEVSGEICLAFELWDPTRKKAEEVGKGTVTMREKEEISARFREYVLGTTAEETPDSLGDADDGDLDPAEVDFDDMEYEDEVPESIEDEEELDEDAATSAPSVASQSLDLSGKDSHAPLLPQQAASLTHELTGKHPKDIPSSTVPGRPGTHPEVALDSPEKRRRRLRLASLKRRSIAKRAYEFSGARDGVSGIVFMEIIRATDLPPEKNVTHTSFDMDPFVVISLGRKTLRTRVIRHNLNPVWEEKMVFQVMKYEQGFTINFTVMDWDKLSGNDFVAKAEFPVQNLVLVSPVADRETGLYDMSGSASAARRATESLSPSQSGLNVAMSESNERSGTNTPVSFTGANSAPPSSPARNRFRFTLSRSTSSTSLQNKQGQQQQQQSGYLQGQDNSVRRRRSFSFRKQRMGTTASSSPNTVTTPISGSSAPVFQIGTPGGLDDPPDERYWNEAQEQGQNSGQGQAQQAQYGRRGSRSSNSTSPSPPPATHRPRTSSSPTTSQGLLTPVPQGEVMEIPDSMSASIVSQHNAPTPFAGTTGAEAEPVTSNTGATSVGLDQCRNVNTNQSATESPPEVSLSPPPPDSEASVHVPDGGADSTTGASSSSSTFTFAYPTSATASGAAAGVKSTASSLSHHYSQSAQSQTLNIDDDLKTYVIPLELANKERWEDKHFPELVIKAKYMPYRALRQQFWRVMLKQYDTDDLQGRVSKVELVSMLDTLGSTLKESTIDGFFERFKEVNMRDSGTLDLTFDQAVMCLEDTLQALQKKTVTLQAKKEKAVKAKKAGRRNRLRNRLTGNVSASQRDLIAQQSPQLQHPASELPHRTTSTSSLSRPKTGSSSVCDAESTASPSSAYSSGSPALPPEHIVPQVVLSKSKSVSSSSSTASVRSRLRSLSTTLSSRRDRERSKSVSELQGSHNLHATAATAGASQPTAGPISSERQENFPPGGGPQAGLAPEIADDERSVVSSVPSVLASFHPDDLADLEDEKKHPSAQGASLLDESVEEVEEHVVEIRECPLCHRPRLSKRSDADIITHLATCASQDWRSVNNLVMGGFVTSSQAQRKWYSKVITKIGYGGYALGANSANILVQDRITGQITEEKMSVYVRLGIRLLYKGLKSKEMEKYRIRKMLKSLSVKQGKKYDDPVSARQIEGFIRFHHLKMEEVLLPLDRFKTFNEFFYRALKPGSRPCCALDEPRIIVSPADCRTVVFDSIHEATQVWVKGREFSIERLLGHAYPQDVSRYINGGSLGVFRLAPQDYHRFHVPVDGIMGQPITIEGEYYTVNPMAIRSALDVYGENVRVIVPIDTEEFGRVMFICVGAMMVGSTVITRKAGERVSRAEELGYFKFGGSTVLLLFEPGVMKFDSDLSRNSAGALETLVRVGMSIGHSLEIPEFKTDQGVSDPSELTPEQREAALRRIEGACDEEEDTEASSEIQVLAPSPVHMRSAK